MMYLGFMLILASFWVLRKSTLPAALNWGIAGGLVVAALAINVQALGMAPAIVTFIASLFLAGIVIAMFTKGNTR
ncbi:hypothetical protein G3R49_17185 [Shewanella sp. WXL01]|uniref:Uncharacterized protein n=1 Tax=Shewanella maritima TaxID=2520507 RepID=A0A411PIB9_9GAMM|nr:MULTISPECIES: hypothetical protein [Shewanella]NKF52296.1 hypothetical protein [Shewanella sp. WXL01]QBF83285.1 hypothetical protein EXU30_11670 [Shewanella maritima]